MSLRERLCRPFGGLKTETADQLEQIVDNFAIEFLNSIRDYERENGSRICFDERDSKELLEIFKNKNVYENKSNKAV